MHTKAKCAECGELIEASLMRKGQAKIITYTPFGETKERRFFLHPGCYDPDRRKKDAEKHAAEREGHYD